MPPRRDLEQGDIAARQLFGGIGQFPTFGSLAQTAQRLQNAVPSAASLAATGISALRNIAASTPLIGRRTPMVQPTTPSAPQLPSGTIAGGFDIYPTTPQMTPRTASATALQPAAPSLAAPTTVPTFPSTGMGLMGNQNIRPLPTEQIAPMASISRIEGGPASMNIAGPITAEAQGRQPIQTPQGTLYATAQQAAAFNAPRTPDTASSRTPEQQQALLAQMREAGARMAGGQEAFFAEKRQEREALRGAEAIARAQGVRSMDIMRAREAATTPSTIAGIRAAASPYQAGPRPSFAMTAQSEFTRNLPVGGSAPRSVTSLGPSGFALYEQQQAARRAAGITGPYSNTRAQQRQATREMARSMGIDPALSRGAQEEQEQYFRSRGLM